MIGLLEELSHDSHMSERVREWYVCQSYHTRRIHIYHINHPKVLNAWKFLELNQTAQEGLQQAQTTRIDEVDAEALKP